ACAWLRAHGVGEVFCQDVSPQRLAAVTAFGATPLPSGAALPSVDLVVEVAGDASVIPAGIKALRPGGEYVWAGMVHPESALDLTGEAVIRKCLTVRGVHNYAPRHLSASLEFLAEHHTRLPFEELISPPLPLDRLADALELTR